MKFCKKYREYMQGREKELPGVGLKRLKKILKRCRRTGFPSQASLHQKLELKDQQFEGEEHKADGDEGSGLQVSTKNNSNRCPDHCPVCDGTFFPSLLKEMSAVVGCFNERARKLLQVHLASGFRKYFMWFKGKLHQNHAAMIHEGKDLVTYAIINSIAMRKILKKYDKDTVFDPVSLTCGHIFCYMCCCSAASVTVVDGLKAADPKAKCPLCRRTGVYQGFVHLDELNILLSRRYASFMYFLGSTTELWCRELFPYECFLDSCPEYWEQRLQSERVERLRQAKEHWESHCRAIMGI